MKIEIPLIFWHGNRDRIMSIDFYPNSNFLVTCGAEAEDKMWIKLWEIEEQETNEIVSINTDLNPFKTSQKNPFIEKENSMTVDETVATGAKIRPKFLYDISGAHTATVNIVRFSPNGIYLASGGDDSAIVLWCQKSRPVEFGSTIEKVVWCNSKILRGHLSDIYDLAWSPDSKYLISGSVDNTATIFSVEKGKGIQKMADHSHFVQGVSWDPRNKYVTTQSSDKSVRVYKNADMKQEVKFYFANALKRNNDNNNKTREEDGLKKKDGNTNQNYFADEILCPSFIRRHCWSPDGSILLLVAGTAKGENEVENVVWGFTRKDLTKPVFMLPTLDKSSTVVRFCPILFNKDTKEEGSPELLDLPYKMVFAIGTLDSLYIYDTQDIVPKYAVTNIHFQPITDLAWKGSSILAASSSDGYITFCVFEKDELGKPADSTTLPEKSKFAYENYINCDIKKNLITNQIPNLIKVVKKKNEKVDNPVDENSNKLVNSVSDGTVSMVVDLEVQNEINNKDNIEDIPNQIDDNINFTHTEQKVSNVCNIENPNININISGVNQPQKRRIQPTLLK